MARCGVTEVCLAPGSRSTPLVLAFAAHGKLKIRVHVDERSAAFFALGVGKASGLPAIMITTSGTAAANVFPAVIEAAQAEVPLIVLTADRPHRLRGADANQAIDQIGLYGRYPRAFHEMAPPSLDARDLRHLRTVACRAVADAVGVPAGPVHLNQPFDKPFEPLAGGSSQDPDGGESPPSVERPDGVPFVAVGPRVPRASESEIDLLVDLMARHPWGLIVTGPSSARGDAADAVLQLAAATGYPLLADPLSGARFHPSHGATVVPAYDLFLGDAGVRDRLAPDLIVRFGAAPTSAALQKYLFHHNGVRHVVVDAAGRWKGHAAVETDYIRADAADTSARLAEKVAMPVEPSWREDWQRAGQAAVDMISQQSPGDEGRVAATLAAALPSSSSLFISNSMPVRDIDAFGLPREDHVLVLGNRGASGIDGVVSSAFGAAAATAGRMVCLIGDLAFLHDQNGMLWSRESDASVVFVLVDNDGGGIFHMLPVREHEPHFTPLFATPHGLDFRHVAQLHGVPFRDVTPAELSGALEGALGVAGTQILRVRTDRDAGRRARGAIADAVARSVLSALG
jgi:2-succinyl-5-enolpyruvyl-6-hydroxy-3-cyclohexene-1-carboxylate synthase